MFHATRDSHCSSSFLRGEPATRLSDQVNNFYLKSPLVNKFDQPIKVFTAINQEGSVQSRKGELIGMLYSNPFYTIENLALVAPSRFTQPTGNMIGVSKGAIVFSQMRSLCMAS